MADSVTIKEFMAVLGYRVDESAQRKFLDAITSMSNAVLGLGAGIAGAAGAVTAAVANMAGSAAQMQYLSMTLNETVSNVDAITFAWQKLGLAPQATMTALQNLANMMRTEPGLAGLWNERAGPGSLTQQFEHMGERFAQMSAQEQRIFRSQFEKYLGTDVINAWLTRGGQAGAGVREFNIVKQLFHFDPDYFAQQSVQFERAWQSFQLRLNDIGGHAATPILERMTASLQGMTEWLDAHSGEILADIDKIGAAIEGAFRGGVDLVRDITGWFEKLSPAGKAAAEALGLISLAFLKPGWLKIAGIAYVLETLLRDYEAFKKTGQSDLGIPWGHIGEQIDNIAKATNGWLSPLTAIEAFFGVRLLLAAKSFFTAVTVGSASAATALTAGLGGALIRLLGLIPKAGPLAFLLGTGAAGGEDQDFSKRKNEEFKRTHPGGFLDGVPDSVSRWWSGHAPGLPGGLPTNQMPQSGSGSGGWLSSFLHMLIPQAEAAEMPANIKALSMNVAKLNDTLSDMSEDGAGGLGSWASGLGSGIVSQLFGGGGGASGGQDAVNINSPEAVEAIKFFMSKGWTLPQAIGIVSNLIQESGLSSTVVNSTGHVGVAQWDQARQQMYQSRTGKSLHSASRMEQYGNVDYELRHNEAAAGFALSQAVDPATATMVIDRMFERSEGKDIGRRLANARALGSNPNVQNATFNGANVNQTNNVTINTSADPNAIRGALDQQHQRQLADLQRNLQGAMH